MPDRPFDTSRCWAALCISGYARRTAPVPCAIQRPNDTPWKNRYDSECDLAGSVAEYSLAARRVERRRARVAAPARRHRRPHLLAAGPRVGACARAFRRPRLDRPAAAAHSRDARRCSRAAAASTSTASSTPPRCSTRRASKARRSKALEISSLLTVVERVAAWRNLIEPARQRLRATTGRGSPRSPRRCSTTTSRRCCGCCAARSSPTARSTTMPRPSCGASAAPWSGSTAPSKRACAGRCAR